MDSLCWGQMMLQDLVQEASGPRLMLGCCSEGSEQGRVSGAAWAGGRPCSARYHRATVHSQRPESQNFHAFIPRQLAWHIFRQCYFCTFQKVEIEKKEKKKLQIDVIFSRSYFNMEITREPTHHFKMLLKSALPHVCLCTCKPVART